MGIARHKTESLEKTAHAAQAVRAARRRPQAAADVPLGLMPGVAFVEESSIGDDSPRDLPIDYHRPTSASSSSRPRTSEYPPSMTGSPVAKGHIRNLRIVFGIFTRSWRMSRTVTTSLK